MMASLHDPYESDSRHSRHGQKAEIPDPGSDGDAEDNEQMDLDVDSDDLDEESVDTPEDEIESRVAPIVSTAAHGVVEYVKKEAVSEPQEQAACSTSKKVDDWKSPFLQSLGSQAVRFFVGKEREPFLIHKDRLCSASEFFRAAFNGNFSEAIKQEMELDDIKVADFAKFAEWVYQGEFPFPHTKTSIDELINLYFLADRFRCNGFKNLVMDKIQGNLRCQSHGKVPGAILTYRQIKRIYKNTISTADSPIRKFCACIISYYIRKGGLQEKVKQTFKINEFTNDYVALQSEIWKVEDGKDRYATALGFCSDPRIRKRDTERCGELECSCFPFDFEEDAGPPDETGYLVCYFHVHEKDEKCKSIPNYDSDCRRLYESD